MKTLEKIRSALIWLLNFAEMQNISRKAAGKKSKDGSQQMMESLEMILTGIINFGKSMLKTVWNAIVFIALSISVLFTLIFPFVVVLGIVIFFIIAIIYLLKILILIISIILVKILWPVVLWSWSFFVQNHETIFLILVGIAILSIIVLALYKLSQKYWRQIFWIWLILSIARIGLYFWLDWRFFSELSLYLLGILGLGVLIFWLSSKDWKKVLFNISYGVLLSLFYIIGTFILSALFVAFVFSVRSCGAETQTPTNTTEKVVEQAPQNVVNQNEDEKTAETIKLITAENGMSVWGILDDCNVQRDSLLSKSIDFSQENKLKMFILTRRNKKVWVTNYSKESIVKNYRKNGKKLVAILPINTKLSWNSEMEELKIIKTE